MLSLFIGMKIGEHNPEQKGNSLEFNGLHPQRRKMFRAKEGHNQQTNIKLEWLQSLDSKELYSDQLLRQKRKKNAEELALKHNMFIDKELHYKYDGSGRQNDQILNNRKRSDSHRTPSTNTAKESELGRYSTLEQKKFLDDTLNEEVQTFNHQKYATIAPIEERKSAQHAPIRQNSTPVPRLSEPHRYFQQPQAQARGDMNRSQNKSMSYQKNFTNEYSLTDSREYHLPQISSSRHHSPEQAAYENLHAGFRLPAENNSSMYSNYLKQMNLHSALDRPQLLTEKLDRSDMMFKNVHPDKLENFLRRKPKPWYIK